MPAARRSSIWEVTVLAFSVATFALCSATFVFCVLARDSVEETRHMVADARVAIAEIDYRMKTEPRRAEFSSVVAPAAETCDETDRPFYGIVDGAVERCTGNRACRP